MSRSLWTAVAAALVMAVGARAESYELTYTFQTRGTPVTVVAAFGGTPSGNLITNISKATLTFQGAPNPRQGFTGSDGPIDVQAVALPGGLPGSAVISFDGTQNNFYLGTGEHLGMAQALTPDFHIFLLGTISADGARPTVTASDTNSSGGLKAGGEVNPTWKIEDVADNGTTLGLLGLALVALHFVRGRSKSDGPGV